MHVPANSALARVKELRAVIARKEAYGRGQAERVANYEAKLAAMTQVARSAA